MLSTTIFVALLLGLLFGSIVLWAFFLRVGLRWAKVPDSTTRRVIIATGTVIFVQIASNVFFYRVSLSSETPSILLGLVEIAAAVIFPCLIIRHIFKTRILSAFKTWVPTLLASVTVLAFNILLIRLFFFEAFVVPNNGMAPTLIGHHWQGACPECGRPSYCSPLDERQGFRDLPRMICGNFHVAQSSNVDKRVHSADRFLVAKFLNPRRWDLVVFHSPENPSILYVMRLVGLPGETIRIEDGAVWVNGDTQEPPDSIRGIEYVSHLADWHGAELWGSAERLALLGDDEYFVLGDFSAQSMDSRMWQHGAQGHNPFAVPESHLIGVVTHVFWPIQRWSILR